jgi:hypothetical protein
MSRRRVAPARAAWTLALLAAASVIAAGQSPAPAAGQLTGTITSATDNRPIGRARIVAVTANQEPSAVLSNADGTFAFGNLPAGDYTISVSRTGYASYTHGQGRRTAAVPITIAPGQTATLAIALQPGRSVAGRVLDEDGTPFAGAVVEALTVRFDGGRDALAAAATARTDDRGEVRLHGLAAGV